jgi:tight adherence protein B
MVESVGTFVLVAAMVVGIHHLMIVGPERRERARLRERVRKTPTPAAQGPTQHSLLLPANRAAASHGARREHWMSAIVGWLVARVRDQSGLRIRDMSLPIASALGACVFFAGARLAGAGSGAAAVLALAGGSVPLVGMFHIRAARLRKFEALLPEAIDVMARALRVGHTLPSALQAVAEEVPDPVGAEFRLLHEQFRFGASLPDVFGRFVERVPLVDTRFLVTAILLQRETGGNLAELLDNLAAVIRDRFRVRRRVRTLTAHGRLTAWILSGTPPAMAIVLLVVKPDYVATLFTDPLGINLLASAVLLELVGVMIVRRVVRVEY